MRIRIDLALPPVPEQASQQAARGMTVHDRAEEAMQNVESDNGNCDVDWKFLIHLFHRLQKCPKWDPDLLTQVEDFILKHGALNGDYAGTFNVHQFNKGKR